MSDGESENIKVAVRVRPFISFENILILTFIVINVQFTTLTVFCAIVVYTLHFMRFV